MNTSIAFSRAEPEVERMSEDVPADGLYVVLDGSPWDAEEVGDRFVVCLCADDRHAYRDRHTQLYLADEERAAQESAAWRGGHVVPVGLYLVVGETPATTPTTPITEETHPSMSRDGNRDLRGDEINRIRQDLDKRSAADVAKAERSAKNAAAKDSAIRSGGDETDRKGLFGTIFGGKK